MLSFLFQEHGISFHFSSLLLSPLKLFQSFSYRFCSFLGKFIPRHFILVAALVYKVFSSIVLAYGGCLCVG